MKTKPLYFIVLFSLTTMSFQNCSGPQAAPGNLTLEDKANANKALGLYNNEDIVSIHYTYSGGFYPTHPPEVQLNDYNGPTPNVTTTYYGFNSDPNEPQSCTTNLPLSAEQLSIIRAALVSARLAHAPTISNMVISDCSLGSLEIDLKDTSKHSYVFQSQCTYNGELSIIDAQQKLTKALEAFMEDSCLTQ